MILIKIRYDNQKQPYNTVKRLYLKEKEFIYLSIVLIILLKY